MSCTNNQSSGAYNLNIKGTVLDYDTTANTITIEMQVLGDLATETPIPEQSIYTFYIDSGSIGISDNYRKWLFENVSIGDSVQIYYSHGTELIEPINAINIYIVGLEHMANQ